MIYYKDTTIFSASQIYELFSSVGWESANNVPMLLSALAKSSHIVSAWDGEKLVGIIRSMDDGDWSATIDCLLVHKDYHRQGIGTALVNKLLEKLKAVKYISVSPDEPKNISFYERFGFGVVRDSRLLQISH